MAEKEEITPRELQFVEALMLGMLPSQAAAHVGVSRQKGLRMSRVPRVAEAIEKRKKALVRKSLFDRKKAIKLLYEAIELAKAIEDPSAIIRAVETLNKMHGYNAPDVVEVRLSADLEKRERQIKELPDEKLLELAAIEGDFEEVKDE